MPYLSPFPLPDLTPSTFLPRLPRSPSFFSPLLASGLLGHISVLRALYLPPVHACFVHDVDFDGFRTSNAGNLDERREKGERREKRESEGLADTLDGQGIGLGLEVDRAFDIGRNWVGGYERGIHGEEDKDRDGEGDGDIEGDGELVGDSEDEEEDGPYLDPFERDWAEKWLNGVVRRAQGWIEAKEGDGEGGGSGEAEDEAERREERKGVEAVLKEATACLAMMAGTSGGFTSPRNLSEGIQLINRAPSRRPTDTTPALPCRPLSSSRLTSATTSYTCEPRPIPRDEQLPRLPLPLSFFPYHLFPPPSESVLFSRRCPLPSVDLSRKSSVMLPPNQMQAPLVRSVRQVRTLRFALDNLIPLANPLFPSGSEKTETACPADLAARCADVGPPQCWRPDLGQRDPPRQADGGPARLVWPRSTGWCTRTRTRRRDGTAVDPLQKAARFAWDGIGAWR